MPDAVITREGAVAVPLDYKVPNGTEIIPRVISASFDGTNAGGAFLAVLEVIAPNGTVTARCCQPESVAAGASVAVSWFPGVGINTADTDQAIAELESVGGSIAITAPEGPLTNIDVAASGVAAATYGDGTHVGQFQVGADGRIKTAASVAITASAGVDSVDAITGAVVLHAGTNIAITDNSPGAGDILIASSGGSGMVKLFDSTLGGAAATIDTGAGGIPAGHGDLIVYLIARTTQVTVNGDALFTFNADTGAHYDYTRTQQTGATLTGASSAAQTAFFCWLSGASASASYPGVVTLVIPSYDQTTFFKVGTMLGGSMDFSSNPEMMSAIFGWRSTAAITRLTATADGASNFAAGSRMVIYGTQ